MSNTYNGCAEAPSIIKYKYDYTRLFEQGLSWIVLGIESIKLDPFSPCCNSYLLALTGMVDNLAFLADQVNTTNTN
jgi:hypothetical protein